MKRDLYTKVVLTIIAICLVWICIKDITLSPGSLYASPNTGRAEIDVNITDAAPYALTYAGPIEVEVTNWPDSLQSPTK